MAKHNFILFCKTFSGDIDTFLIQAKSVNKYNINNIPYYVSIPEHEIELFNKLKHEKSLNFEIISDSHISNLIQEKNFTPNGFTADYINQQLVKLEFAKTDIAKHYLVLDADCYFIRNFDVSDFLLDDDTPYLPITEGCKGDRYTWQIFQSNYSKMKKSAATYVSTSKKISLREFIGRKGKSYTLEMPFVITSNYVIDLENSFLKNKNMTLADTLIEYPSEMGLYLEYVLLKRFNYQACNAFFFPHHTDASYQINRWLGFDEDIISQHYLGILMNKGFVKSLKYKPNFIGKYIIRNIIRFYNKISKQRVPILIKLLLGIIPSRNLRTKIRNYLR